MGAGELVGEGAGVDGELVGAVERAVGVEVVGRTPLTRALPVRLGAKPDAATAWTCSDGAVDVETLPLAWATISFSRRREASYSNRLRSALQRAPSPLTSSRSRLSKICCNAASSSFDGAGLGCAECACEMGLLNDVYQL